MSDRVRRSLVFAMIPAESRFKPVEAYVPGGYIAGRHKRYGDDTMDESFFPITWTEQGYQTPFISAYCGDGLTSRRLVSV